MGEPNFLDSVSKSARPEPNVPGNFDCQECYEPVGHAHYDRRAKVLRWWCGDGHESIIEKIEL